MKSLCKRLVPVMAVLILSLVAPAHAGVMDAVSGIDALIDEVNRARDILRDVEQSGDEAKIFDAQEELQIRENELEDARIDAIAREANVSPGQVKELRASGMGWGRIAKELGVHPSVVGMGKGNAKAMGRKGKGYDDDDELLNAYDDDDAPGKGKNKNKGNKNKDKDKGGKGKK